MVKMIGDIVKGIAALTGKIGAGIDAELRIECADTTISRRVELGKLDSLLHQAGNGGSMLADHPIVHGLHQHQDHILSCQQPGHFVFIAFRTAQVGIQLRFRFTLRFSIGRGQRIDLMIIKIFGKHLVQTADLIQTVSIEHIFICRFCRLHPSIVTGSQLICLRAIFQSLIVEIIHCIGQHQGSSNGCNHQKRRYGAVQTGPFPPREFPKQQNTHRYQHQQAQPPFSRIAQQDTGIVCAFGGITKIGQPHHLPEQQIISRLKRGIQHH